MNIFSSTDLSGSGTISNFASYKWFIIIVSASGFNTSHFIDISILTSKKIPFISSYYYSDSSHAMASIGINKNGEYLIGQGLVSNSSNSSVSVWAKK